jgi:hypothetical protein
VKIVNNASALLLGDPTINVSSGDGKSVKLTKGASTVFDYPENTSASTYTVSAKCAAVSVNVSARVTVAAKPVVATPVDPAPEPAPDPGGGSGGGSDTGSGGDSGTPAQPGTGSGPGTPTDTGSNPGQPGGAGGGTDAKPVPGATLPMGFAEPPVRIGAPGAGLPIPDVATGIPGAPGEASAPDVELFGTSAVQAAAQEDTRPVAAQSSDGHPSRRILLILVATVLLLGVGAAALRAVRGTRSVPVAARG